jgi:hypothetical protein
MQQYKWSRSNQAALLALHGAAIAKATEATPFGWEHSANNDEAGA